MYIQIYQNNKKNDMNKIYITTLFMVLFSMHAYATIGIISITNPTTTNDEYGNPTISNCDGTIDLVADGNAGPFTFAWSNGATIVHCPNR
jgi:hypothetical protein